MSLLAHIMKDRDAADIPVFPLALEISKEIDERYRNMSPAELREAFNIERGSLQVCKPGGSMPSVDSIARQRDLFLDFCNAQSCADCPLLPYKHRGERFACAIAWARMLYTGGE